MIQIKNGNKVIQSGPNYLSVYCTTSTLSCLKIGYAFHELLKRLIYICTDVLDRAEILNLQSLLKHFLSRSLLLRSAQWIRYRYGNIDKTVFFWSQLIRNDTSCQSLKQWWKSAFEIWLWKLHNLFLARVTRRAFTAPTCEFF